MNFANSQIHDFSLPQLDEVSLKPISKDYYKIIAVNKIVLYAILFALLFVAKSFVDGDTFQNNFWYALTILLLICLFDFVISYLAIKKRKYAIREHDVIYAKGLLVNSITTVPISRIQHIEESRSWLARKFHLSTLNIFTAGEAGSDLSIKGLPREEAKQINDFLSSKVNGKSGLLTTD